MNRKTYIDYMRAFAILLVIAGHANSFNDPVKISGKESPGIVGSIHSLGITVFVVDIWKPCKALLWKLSIDFQCRIINVIVVFAHNVYCVFYFTDFDKNQKKQ